MQSLALDIDGVITANPDFFRFLSYLFKKNGWYVDIITSRNPKRKKETEEELKKWDISYDTIHFMSTDLPRDYKTQGEWKVQKVNYLGSTLWIDNEFKVYEKVVGVDFSDCRAQRISI